MCRFCDLRILNKAGTQTSQNPSTRQPPEGQGSLPVRHQDEVVKLMILEPLVCTPGPARLLLGTNRKVPARGAKRVAAEHHDREARRMDRRCPLLCLKRIYR